MSEEYDLFGSPRGRKGEPRKACTYTYDCANQPSRIFAVRRQAT